MSKEARSSCCYSGIIEQLAPSDPEDILIFGELVLNFATCRVHVNGLKMELGPTEFRMLHFFMRHPEKVHSRKDILRHVWKWDVVVGERTVDVHIKRLRAAMAPSKTNHFVQTVRDRGYRFSQQA